MLRDGVNGVFHEVLVTSKVSSLTGVVGVVTRLANVVVKGDAV